MAAILKNDGTVEIVRDVVGPGDARLTDARVPEIHGSDRHDATVASRDDITGLVPATELGTNIATAAKWLRGDQTWDENLHASEHSDGGSDEITTALDPRAYPLGVSTLASRPAATVANAGRMWWTTDEHILYVNDPGGVWTAIAVIDYADLVGKSIVNADVNAAAAIAYSKLNLAGSIVNADVNAAAAIAYSKLALAAAIKNSDLISSAGVLADMPPARELTYNQITAPVTISATAEASATTIVTASAFTFDGSTPVLIEFFSPYLELSANAAETVSFCLFDGGSSIGVLGRSKNRAAVLGGEPIYLQRRITPSAASHTYSIRAIRVSANCTLQAGAGGSGAFNPAYIRISKV